jgi:anhydro-N-acetylmuramic acid kinase
MAYQSSLVLGMMSGTSVDGIDVALARISGAPPRLKSELLRHTRIGFSAALRNEILRVAEGGRITAGELSQLNFRLGQCYAEAALLACRRFRVSPSRVALIGSHGQTVFHQGRPSQFLGRSTASTLQLGDASVIAAHSGITTVADFRPADLALGGQGAPLVPYADYLLYRHKNLGRVSLNLGGIANITVLPAAARPSQIRAFDTGPGNMVIDALVQQFSRGRRSYDQDARLALSGQANLPLLNEMLRDPYLHLPPPKSTGREYFGSAYVEKLLSAARRYRARPADLVRAATIFTALSIVDALHRFVLPRTKIHQLIVSGGGANNPLIVAQLAAALPHIDVFSSARLGIPVDAKEAYAFALLAYESFHQRPANLPSATGARRPALLGKIAYAPPR